jgi:hypothetical protein
MLWHLTQQCRQSSVRAHEISASDQGDGSFNALLKCGGRAAHPFRNTQFGQRTIEQGPWHSNKNGGPFGAAVCTVVSDALNS